MKRTLLLLLAIALMAFTLPALAGDNATGSDAAATESANADTASGAGMSLRDMVGSIIDSGQTAGQDTDGQTTQEHSGGAASTDTGVSSGSILTCGIMRSMCQVCALFDGLFGSLMLTLPCASALVSTIKCPV